MSATDFRLSLTALDRLAAEGRSIAFWWRDDDARVPTPALDRLTGLARHHDLPLALAVIPDGAEPALAEHLAGDGRLSVLLHGQSHANHAPAGEKRAEFGDHRPGDAMAAEIAAGRAKLENLFGGCFMPVFVPPWNRIGETARFLLPTLGLPVLSVYGRARPPLAGRAFELNTHLDVMDWRAMGGLTFEAADARLSALIEARADVTLDNGAGPEPVGVLTHHLQHDEAAWSLVEALFDLLASHSAVSWPDLKDLLPTH